MIFIWIVIGGIILYLLLSMIEQRFLVTTKYDIKSPKLGNNFDGLKIVVLSDLHNHTIDRNNKKLLNKIEELSPDIILVAGDMITKYKPCFPSNAFSLMENLATRYPIYYAYGNHEQNMEALGLNPSSDQIGISEKQIDRKQIDKKQIEKNQINEKQINDKQAKQRKMIYSTWVEYKTKLKKLGVIFLDNEQITITKGSRKISISGVSLDKIYFQKFKNVTIEKDYLNSLVKKKEDAFQILIAHSPIYFHDYINWGADLILSGHVHGGIVRLPFIGGIISPQVRLFPKYDAGLFEENNQKMIVSRGLGSHSNMPRLFNPPELIFITLK